MEQRKPNGKPGGPVPRPAAKPAAGKPPAAKSAAAKPAAKSAPPKSKPGDGLLGWLGRQVGHVSKAVKADVTKPSRQGPSAKPAAKGPAGPRATAGSQPAPKRAAAAKPPADPGPPADFGPPAGAGAVGVGGTIIYRHDEVEEAELPDRPGVILRRTIIDEVVVETPPEDERDQRAASQ